MSFLQGKTKILLLAGFVGLLAIGAALMGRGGSAAATQRQLLPPLECQVPSAYKEAYTPQAMDGNRGGIPEFSFPSNTGQAQRISISDAEERDMDIELDVDNKFYRKSTTAKFNAKVECGRDISRCRGQKFSQLVAVVPPGEHNVTIRWQPMDGHPAPVKGKMYTFLWERVLCKSN